MRTGHRGPLTACIRLPLSVQRLNNTFKYVERYTFAALRSASYPHTHAVQLVFCAVLHMLHYSDIAVLNASTVGVLRRLAYGTS